MVYRDNPQHRVPIAPRGPFFTATTAVYFYSGRWCIFSPALTLHRTSDWVVTVNRNACIEYFDSPGEMRSVYDAFLID